MPIHVHASDLCAPRSYIRSANRNRSSSIAMNTTSSCKRTARSFEANSITLSSKTSLTRSARTMLYLLRTVSDIFDARGHPASKRSRSNSHQMVFAKRVRNYTHPTKNNTLIDCFILQIHPPPEVCHARPNNLKLSSV